MRGHLQAPLGPLVRTEAAWAYLHVGFEIVLASTAEWAQWTLMAFETRVDHHMPLPVALPLDH